MSFVCLKNRCLSSYVSFDIYRCQKRKTPIYIKTPIDIYRCFYIYWCLSFLTPIYIKWDIRKTPIYMKMKRDLPKTPIHMQIDLHKRPIRMEKTILIPEGKIPILSEVELFIFICFIYRSLFICLGFFCTSLFAHIDLVLFFQYMLVSFVSLFSHIGLLSRRLHLLSNLLIRFFEMQSCSRWDRFSHVQVSFSYTLVSFVGLFSYTVLFSYTGLLSRLLHLWASFQSDSFKCWAARFSFFCSHVHRFSRV